MARRYLQTGPNASPDFGGVTSLAIVPANVNLPIEGAAAPTVGQVFSINGGGNAEFLPPPASGIVDDPVIRTGSFTAVLNQRHYLSSFFSISVTFPVGFEGDVFALAGLYGGFGGVTFPGTIVDPYGLTYGGVNYPIRGLALTFRFSSGAWNVVDSTLAATFYGAGGHAFISSTGGGYPQLQALSDGNALIGRVANFGIQQLLSYNAAHVLYSDGYVINVNSGSMTAWLAGSGETRASMIAWQAASDLIIRGVRASDPDAEFRQDKIILNNTGEFGTQDFKNIVWSLEDTGATSATYRVRGSGSVPSTGFGEYIQAPGETVVLRWNNTAFRWFLTALSLSGRVDRKLATTSVTPAIIHTFTTRTNSRVIAYKVQVQARKTIGTTVGDSALFDIAVLCERNSVGTVVVKDVVFTNGPYKDAGAAAWDVTFTISGSDIQMNVVGDAVDTVQWRVTGNITEHG